MKSVAREPKMEANLLAKRETKLAISFVALVVIGLGNKSMFMYK